MNIEVLWDGHGTYGLLSLSDKTGKSNRLQMSLQKQHFLLSYLKTLSVGLAGVWTHDLPHGCPVLNQLSQPESYPLFEQLGAGQYHRWNKKI